MTTTTMTTQVVTMTVLTRQTTSTMTMRKQTTTNLCGISTPASKIWMNGLDHYPVRWRVWRKTRKRMHLND